VFWAEESTVEEKLRLHGKGGGVFDCCEVTFFSVGNRKGSSDADNVNYPWLCRDNDDPGAQCHTCSLLMNKEAPVLKAVVENTTKTFVAVLHVDAVAESVQPFKNKDKGGTFDSVCLRESLFFAPRTISEECTL